MSLPTRTIAPANWKFVTELFEGKRKQFQIEKKYRRKDGSVIWVSNNVSLVPGTELEPRFIMALSEDITERKCALEKLQANQELLDLAQKAARALAFDWHIQESVNTWSPEQEALYGLAPGTFDGTYESWKKLVHPEDWALIGKALRRAQETGHISAEYRVIWPDGSTHWLAANGQMLFDDQGQPLRMVGFTADVTSRVQARIALEEALTEIKLLKDELFKENLALRDEVDRVSMFEEIVGTSRPLRTVLSQVIRVAPNDSTVLITGETGTGKELFARAIHKRSHRSQRAFVSVNCAALAPSLISSELFGHEKGAFTGAVQRRIGRFESANGGTIFLDEVGESHQIPNRSFARTPGKGI